MTSPDLHEDERAEIIEAFKDSDPALYERFHLSRLFKYHSSVLDLALEKQLAKAARLRFEADWDEAIAAAADAYTTMYLIAGVAPDEAQEKAEELANDGAGGMAALAALI